MKVIKKISLDFVSVTDTPCIELTEDGTLKCVQIGKMTEYDILM